MMKFENSDERMIVSVGLFALTGSFGALTAALAILAMDHMAFAAGLCGPVAGHCLLCVGAAASLAAAIGTGAAGMSLLRPGHPGRSAA